jgi:hypothetical protein
MKSGIFIVIIVKLILCLKTVGVRISGKLKGYYNGTEERFYTG